jgi:hypothetical protein
MLFIQGTGEGRRVHEQEEICNRGTKEEIAPQLSRHDQE